MAIFHFSGNFPSERDLFTMLVIGSTRISKHFFSNLVGMGSNEVVELDIEPIILSIESDESKSKFASVGRLQTTDE